MGLNWRRPVVERLYAAALSPDDWAPLIESIQIGLGADHIFLSRAASAPAMGYETGAAFVASAGIDQRNLTRLLSYTPEGPQSPLEPRWEDFYRPGVVVNSAEVISDADVERSRLYNELVRPAEGFYSLTWIGDRDSSFTLCVCRGRRAGAFGPVQKRDLQSLTPHIALAAELGQRLKAADRRQAGWLGMMERLKDGVILCEGRARPGFMNRRAVEILNEVDGLALVEGRLIADTQAESRRLHDEIAAAGAPDCLATRRLALRRRSGRTPLILHLMPTWRLANAESGPQDAIGSAVAIFIQESDAPAPVEDAILCDLFSLTRREAQVAAQLTAGLTAIQISAKMNLSVGAIRSHLKQVFAKTGVHSQVGLVALVRSCVGVWR